jgi:hypothetical protein
VLNNPCVSPITPTVTFLNATPNVPPHSAENVVGEVIGPDDLLPEVDVPMYHDAPAFVIKHEPTMDEFQLIIVDAPDTTLVGLAVSVIVGVKGT